MSSRIVARTLKFCTCSVNTVCSALDILQLPYVRQEKSILVQGMNINVNGEKIYVDIISGDLRKENLFLQINSKIAEMERQLRIQSINKNRQEQEIAAQESETYRARQLKREQDRLDYEQQKLQLEQKSFIEAKKSSIIAKAKEKGYSVQESVEDGVVKLKLVRRIY